MRTIDADKLKSKLQKMINQVSPGNPERGFALEEALDELNAAETVRPGEYSGKWKKSDKMDTTWWSVDRYACSRCGSGMKHRTLYCPNCGAKMYKEI